MRTERIIQFGEGNFLRGFVDFFVQRMNESNNFDGSIVVVQPLEKGMVDILNDQDGHYNLFLRGLENGQATENHFFIDCISRGINPYTHYDDYINLAKQPELRFIVSNTTESGIQFNPSDTLLDHPASSYPGKLTQLLYERYTLHLPGFIIMPCELIDDNATELKKLVLRYVDAWKLPEDFKHWILTENQFLNTLVDRIVTGYPKDEVQTLTQRLGYEDKLLNTAELFHLWVIEGNAEAEFPLQKTGLNVIWTQDVKPYKERKVRILNGAHTCLVPLAILKGYKEVKESLEDPVVEKYITDLIFDEVIPTLTLPQTEMIDFAYAVLDRFKNPYIHHALNSIALNSFDKFKVRVMPSILIYKALNHSDPKLLMQAFDAFYEFYQTDKVNDSLEVVEFVRNHSKEEVFKTLCE